MKAMAVVAIGFLIAGVGVTAASALDQAPPTTPPVKVWVCKYVGTPGVNETLKTGNDGLIEVSANALTDEEVTVGAWFADAHGRSLVVQIGGDRPDISICPVPDVAVDMNLTYMTACAPDATNTWRIRNSSDMLVPYTLEYYGQGVVASGVAPVGDSFVNLPRETATAILKWGGGDSGIIAGSKTKASGVDEDCGIELTGVSVTAAGVPICGPNNDPLNIPVVEGLTFDDTGWVNNMRTITAVPDEGYFLDGQSEWTFTDVPTAGCSDEPPAFSYTPPSELAYTGPLSGTNGLAALAAFLMAGGAALVGLKVRAQE